MINVASLDKAVIFENAKGLARGNLGIPILLLVMLAMMTLPIPPLLLDVFFTFNITIALVVLCVSVYALRPLDFAVFPTILLVATLLRLALNVASTRVVLLNGHEGGSAAGQVIESFGEVVIGGNYAVGLIVFIILIIINFVVVTKGAGRIAEVSARFTLDAMPGKQIGGGRRSQCRCNRAGGGPGATSGYYSGGGLLWSDGWCQQVCERRCNRRYFDSGN